MPTSDSETPNYELSLTSSDIYLAAEQGVLLQEDAERLVRWGFEQHFNQSRLAEPKALPVERRKGWNLVTIGYYFGAMLMISACAWFLGDKWDALGSPGILGTVIVYILIAVGLGGWLRNKGYIIGGGLLITVAVCLVPLLTYAIEDITGLWPSAHPGPYENYYPWINGSWIVMELATIAAAAMHYAMYVLDSLLPLSRFLFGSFRWTWQHCYQRMPISVQKRVNGSAWPSACARCSLVMDWKNFCTSRANHAQRTLPSGVTSLE
jgi:hypothetical protein